MSNKYKIIKAIGEGISGTIYKATTKNGDNFALKTIRYDFADNNAILEIDVLGRLNHPNIIKISDLVIIDSETLALFTPLASFTLETATGYSIDEKIDIMYQCAKGLEFLHHNRILHMDLKLSNIVMTADGPKIIDFGTSILQTTEELLMTNGPITTPYIRAPEITLNGGPIGYFSDVWSFSISMLTFISDLSSDDLIALIGNDNFTMILDSKIIKVFDIDKSTTLTTYLDRSDLITFFQSIIEVDYEQRLKMSQIVNLQLLAALGKDLIVGKINRIYNHDKKYYSEKFYTVRNIIIKILSIYFDQEDSVVLFLSIDLFHRCLHKLYGENIKKWYSVMIACIVLALRYDTTCSDFSLVVEQLLSHLHNYLLTLVTQIQLLKIEKEVLQYLDYSIFSCPLYELCPTAYHLKMAYNSILLSADATSYLTFDVASWVGTLPVDSTNVLSQTKNITIGDLIA